MRPSASGPFDDHPRRGLTRTRRAVLKVRAAAKYPVSVREPRAATGAMELETVRRTLQWLAETCLAREAPAGPGNPMYELAVSAGATIRSVTPSASGVFARLARHGQRLTRTRRAVIESLAAANRAASVREPHSAAGAVDLVTVYRALHRLIQLGLVREATAGPGSERHELAGAR